MPNGVALNGVTEKNREKKKALLYSIDTAAFPSSFSASSTIATTYGAPLDSRQAIDHRLGIALCKAARTTIRCASNDRGVPCEGSACGCSLEVVPFCKLSARVDDAEELPLAGCISSAVLEVGVEEATGSLHKLRSDVPLPLPHGFASRLQPGHPCIYTTIPNPNQQYSSSVRHFNGHERPLPHHAVTAQVQPGSLPFHHFWRPEFSAFSAPVGLPAATHSAQARLTRKRLDSLRSVAGCGPKLLAPKFFMAHDIDATHANAKTPKHPTISRTGFFTVFRSDPR